MKKKVIKKTPAKKADKSSVPETAEELKKIMARMANQKNIDTATFDMLSSVGDAGIIALIKKNPTLTKQQKRSLGIVEVPFVYTEAWKNLNKDEAKKHLFEALKEAVKNWKEEDSEGGDFLHKFIGGGLSGVRILDFSKEESEQILEICRPYLDANWERYRRLVSMILGKKGCRFNLDPKFLGEEILNDSTEFVRVLNTLPKETQTEVIDRLAASPIDIRIYISFIDYCFPGLGVWDEAKSTLRLGYGSCEEEIYDVTNAVPGWTADFLRRVKLSQKDQAKFDKIISRTFIDIYENIKCPEDVISAATDAGMTFVKGYSNFDQWLLKRLKTPNITTPQQTKDTSMPEQIAKWITEEAVNINKTVEIVEMANQTVSK